MRRPLVLTGLVLVVAAGAAMAQTPPATTATPASPPPPTALTNSVGMDFIRIEPGTMQVGVFHPDCANGARAGGAVGVGGAGGGRGAAATPAGGVPAIGGAPAAAAGAGRGGGAAGGGGAAAGAAGGGRAGAPAAARDPRMSWDAADLAACQAETKAEASDGFPVTLKKPYLIEKAEVTQAQWKAVMGVNPSTFQSDKVADADSHPVENVSWQDAQAFVAKLNAKEKTKTYRLPSELEWEYACRAGGPGQETWADIRTQAVIQLSTAVGGGRGGAAAATPAPATEDAMAYTARTGSTAKVATKAANAWGLYDMLGNVWEWTADPYNGKMFPDATPPKTGSQHVLKGGSFAADVKNAICATHGFGPGDGFNVGFRVVKDVQ